MDEQKWQVLFNWLIKVTEITSGLNQDIIGRKDWGSDKPSGVGEGRRGGRENSLYVVPLNNKWNKNKNF